MRIGANVYHFESCTSTNDLARALAAHGVNEGVVVTADVQTAGRGTKGRTWHSAKGKGLYLSVILRPPAEVVAFLPLMSGVSVREALSNAVSLEVGLKWPNDLVIAGKKLGGILCESQWTGRNLDFAVAGIGLNLSHAPGDFPPDIRKRATSVQIALGRPLKQKPLLDHLFARMDFWYGLLRRGKREDVLKEYERRIVLPPGRRMTVLHAGGRFTGLYRGLLPDGGILLESSAGGRAFSAAEITELIYEKN